MTAKTALLVIDAQNDYFDQGAFPLWQTENIKANILNLINQAKSNNIPIIHIQHIADPAQGLAPFFNQDTVGVEIDQDILGAAPNAPIIIKQYADAFEKTDLSSCLADLGITNLVITGMMTQNCITHTAISKAAEEYDITVVSDATTTVSEILHLIALHALSTRVNLLPGTEISF